MQHYQCEPVTYRIVIYKIVLYKTILIIKRKVHHRHYTQPEGSLGD